METPQRLVFLCPEFTPYHETLFDALVADGRFTLRVVIMMGPTHTHPFAARTQRPYPWQMADPHARMDWRLIRRLLAEEPESWFMVSSYYTPTLIGAMVAFSYANKPFLYWTDTPLPQDLLWHDRLPASRPWWQRLGRRTLLRWIFTHAHRSLVTGQFGVRAIRQLGCPADKSVDFPHWVVLGEPPARLQQKERPPLRTLLGIGQLIYRKGWEIAIQALAQARRTHPALQLWLVGDGEERPRLEETVREMGLSEHVLFLGWKQPPEIAEILSKADALIHPARWEPYGVVVLEAMAAGLPVLGSHATGAAVDRVVPGVSGFIHTVGDVAQLAGQIVELASDGSLLHTMQQEARRMAERWPPQMGVDIIHALIHPAPSP